jgi:hypothetical protein
MALSRAVRERLARVLASDLEGGYVEVVNGAQSERVPISAVRVVGDEVTVIGTFGQSQGNFEWSERRLVSAAGEIVDTEVRDFGRKAIGSVWGVEAAIVIPEGTDTERN